MEKNIKLFSKFIKKINIKYFYLLKLIKWKQYHYIPIILTFLIYVFIRDLILEKRYIKLNYRNEKIFLLHWFTQRRRIKYFKRFIINNENYFIF